jgi:hypothetical protein
MGIASAIFVRAFYSLLVLFYAILIIFLNKVIKEVKQQRRKKTETNI